MLRGSCLEVGCLSVLVLLAGLLAPTHVEAQEGRVFRVSGDWRFASHTSQLVEQGQAVNAADTLIPPFDPRRSERIAMWFEQGRVACTVRRGGELECFGVGNTACANVGNPGRVAVWVGIAECLADEEPHGALSFLKSILHVFGEDPMRYIPLLSRSSGAAVGEAVLMAGQETLPLQGLIPGFPAGQYRICMARLQEVSDLPDELCDDVYWNGHEGGWPPTRKADTPWRFVPGLYDLTVVGTSSMSSAWIFLAHPDRFEEAKAAFAEAENTTGSWPGADRVEIRAALRALLVHLGSG